MDPMKRIIIVRFLFLSPSPTLTNLENTDLRAKGPEQRSRPVLSIVPSYQPQDSTPEESVYVRLIGKLELSR